MTTTIQPLLPETITLQRGNTARANDRLQHTLNVSHSTSGRTFRFIKVWQNDAFYPISILLSRDDTPHGPLLHLSVSRPAAIPGWYDLKAIKEAVFGDIDAMIMLPRASSYINANPHCLHIFQTPEPWQVTG